MSAHLWDVCQTAGYLGVSEKTVRRHAAQLGGVKLGALLRFHRSDIDRYLEGRRLDGRTRKSIEPGANRARQDGRSPRESRAGY